ncbi:hypothetical protein [Pseudomonas tohonis]|uniref:hypothetical protein n=1 Tax=Pseudomonas tohonis TaxID=2725477 RepID=UPI0022F081C9|nr:hypothetical protein [Pseudomonas tohonis]
MALRSPLLSIGLLLLPATVSAATLDAAQSRYQGAVSCIDRLFYDGGYDVGDARREALITEFLAHYQLPAYDEARYAAGEGADIDRDAYMAGYQLCEEDVDYVTKLGAKHGRHLPSE